MRCVKLGVWSRSRGSPEPLHAAAGEHFRRTADSSFVRQKPGRMGSRWMMTALWLHAIVSSVQRLQPLVELLRVAFSRRGGRRACLHARSTQRHSAMVAQAPPAQHMLRNSANGGAARASVSYSRGQIALTSLGVRELMERYQP